MDKTVAQKMGIKQDTRTYFQNAPGNFCEIIQAPSLNVIKALEGEVDYIHLFVGSVTELEKAVEDLKPYLSKAGHFWVSWPKSKKLETDLSLAIIIKMIYQAGLVESKVLSIDTTWSAIKLTRPIKGKVYKNHFGNLNQNR